MFKNREVRIAIAKKADATPTTGERQPLTMSTDEIKIVTDFVKTTALFVGGVWLTGKLIDAACDLYLKTSTNK